MTQQVMQLADMIADMTFFHLPLGWHYIQMIHAWGHCHKIGPEQYSVVQ
jgi:hypothetical protein